MLKLEDFDFEQMEIVVVEFENLELVHALILKGDRYKNGLVTV
jgi:hypothetical protein